MKLVGPMKRKMILSVVVTAVVIIFIFSLAGFFIISNYNKRIEDLEIKAETEIRYVLTKDISANHVITSADIVLKEVKAGTVPGNSFPETTKVTDANKEIINFVMHYF